VYHVQTTLSDPLRETGTPIQSRPHRVRAIRGNRANSEIRAPIYRLQSLRFPPRSGSPAICVQGRYTKPKVLDMGTAIWKKCGYRRCNCRTCA